MQAGVCISLLTRPDAEVRVVNDAPSLTFVPSTYTVETGEAERIAVDHVARIVESDINSTSQRACAERTSADPTPLTPAAVGAHLTGMQSAATMLAARVKLLHEYVSGVADGRLAHNHALLRQVAAFLRQLPITDSPAFEREFLSEVNDTLLMMQLCSMTSGVAQLQDIADRSSVIFAGGGRTRAAARGGFV